MAFGGIGMTGRDQPLDDHDHLLDMRGRARFLIRRQCAQSRHVGVEIGCGARGYRGDRLPALPRAVVDLVVHVGDVPNVEDVWIQSPQQPRDDIVHHHRPRIADMRKVVHRGSAHIHPNIGRIGWFEPLLTAGQSVVQRKSGHRSVHHRPEINRRGFVRETGRQRNAI